jgi:hypothetical protein
MGTNEEEDDGRPEPGGDGDASGGAGGGVRPPPPPPPPLGGPCGATGGGNGDGGGACAAPLPPLPLLARRSEGGPSGESIVARRSLGASARTGRAVKPRRRGGGSACRDGAGAARRAPRAGEAASGGARGRVSPPMAGRGRPSCRGRDGEGRILAIWGRCGGVEILKQSPRLAHHIGVTPNTSAPPGPSASARSPLPPPRAPCPPWGAHWAPFRRIRAAPGVAMALVRRGPRSRAFPRPPPRARAARPRPARCPPAAGREAAGLRPQHHRLWRGHEGGGAGLRQGAGGAAQRRARRERKPPPRAAGRAVQTRARGARPRGRCSVRACAPPPSQRWARRGLATALHCVAEPRLRPPSLSATLPPPPPPPRGGGPRRASATWCARWTSTSCWTTRVRRGGRRSGLEGPGERVQGRQAAGAAADRARPRPPHLDLPRA